MIELIKQHFSESIQLKIESADQLANTIAQAGEKIITSLLHEGKVMACGNGASGSCAQYFVSHLVNRFETDRPSLPAIALNADATNLTAIANDYTYTDIFSKQVRTLAHPSDILFLISSTANTSNLCDAIEAAHLRDLPIIALTGEESERITSHLRPEDIQISVSSHRACRIQEAHLLILNTLCDLIDHTLFEQVSES